MNQNYQLRLALGESSDIFNTFLRAFANRFTKRNFIACSKKSNP